VRPKLDQVLVLAAVVGIAVGVVVLLSASAAPLGLGAVACGCSLLAFASLGVLAVAASWLVQSSRRATGLVLRASPVIALAAGGLALAAGAAASGACSPPGLARGAGDRAARWKPRLTRRGRSAGCCERRHDLIGTSASRHGNGRTVPDAGADACRHRHLPDAAGPLGRGPGSRRSGPPHLAGCAGCRAPAVAPAVLWRDALALIRNPSRLVCAGFVCVGGT